MNAYFSLFRLRMVNGLQYRAAAAAGMMTQFFWGFMYTMIYEAFFASTTAALPITLEQLITYVWLQQAFLWFIMLWFRDGEIFNLITSGNIAYELCRPCGLYGLWYAKLIAQRLSAAALRCLPILFIAFWLPEPYRLLPPADFTAFGLFMLTLVLGLMLVVAISMFIYISVFITMSPAGSLTVFSIIGEFFAGGIIPVPLMPSWLQTVAYLLPFRLAADLPFRVYSGNIPPAEAVTSIGVQLVWLAVLVFLGRHALAKVLKQVVVQGG